MKKQGYYVSENVQGGVAARYVSGYVVEREVNGSTYLIGIRKDGKHWTVDEVATGLGMNPGHKFGKRAEALAYVNGEPDEQMGRVLVEGFGKYLEKHPHTYKAQVYAMQVLQQRKTPWPLKEHQAYIDKRMKEFAEQAGVVKKADEQKEEPMKDETKKQEPLSLKGEVVCITGTLPSMTRSAAFTKLKLAGGTPSERFTSKVTVLVVASNMGKTKRDKADKARAKGQKFVEVSGVEFEAALEAMFTAPVKAEPKPVTPPPVKDETKKPAAPKPPVRADGRKEQELELKKRIEELEAELSRRSAELEQVWKENEHLKAAKPEPKEQEAATTVSLESMQKWCEGKGLVATQKREGTCIWVEGESTPYRDELVEMGFRFAKKRKSWYLNPAA